MSVSRLEMHNMAIALLITMMASMLLLLTAYLGEQLNPDLAVQAKGSKRPRDQEQPVNASPATVQNRPKPEKQSAFVNFQQSASEREIVQKTPELLLPKAVTAPSTPTLVPRTSDSYFITGVPSSRQERNLNCEFTSASDLAKYHGFDVDWQTIFMAVGFDPNGDPNVGFVGKSIGDTPKQLYPSGYGVYAEPIARGLVKVGVNVQAYQGMDRKWLKKEIQANRPVIIWAPFDMAPSELTGWFTVDGKTWITAVQGEHTFTVIGYDQDGVYVNDPWYGQVRHFNWSLFEQAWSYLNNMAVAIEPTIHE